MKFGIRYRVVSDSQDMKSFMPVSPPPRIRPPCTPSKSETGRLSPMATMSRIMMLLLVFYVSCWRSYWVLARRTSPARIQATPVAWVHSQTSRTEESTNTNPRPERFGFAGALRWSLNELPLVMDQLNGDPLVTTSQHCIQRDPFGTCH